MQHVSTLEGVDREPANDEPCEFPHIRRKISYDILQPPTEAPPLADQRPGISAYKHSTVKRISMWLLSDRMTVANTLKSRL